MFGGSRQGSCWVQSKKDPRWDHHWTDVSVGMFSRPSDAEVWVELCKEKYGEQPDDLEFGYMKY